MTKRASLQAAVAVLSLVLSLVLHAPAPAQDVRLTNMAARARTQWVDVAVPAADAAGLPRVCRLDPQGWIAIKGPAVGVHSVIFHVLADLAGGQTVTGRLLPAANGSIAPFAMSDWVADSTLDVLPIPVVWAGGRECRLVRPTFELVEAASPVRLVFRLRGRIQHTPLVYDCYLYLYSHQDVVRVECTFTNSDPSTPAMSFFFDAMWLESGELLQLDYRHLLGMLDPIRLLPGLPHPSSGKWVQLLSGPRVMGRAQQIHVTGNVLPLPTPLGRPSGALTFAAGGMTRTMTVADRLDTLVATMDRPAVGCWTRWQDKWLAFGRVPEVPVPDRANGGWSRANGRASAFRNLERATNDLYVQRPLGLNRGAGTTGAQEDFGATKGSMVVTVGDPRHIHELGYSVHELFFRPFHNREPDGSPILARNHPSLQTWSQLINCRTTGDRLGMACPLPFSWPDNGWSGFDDQHRSQNNFHALLALTGSRALKATLKDLLEIDLAQVPGRQGAPRAQGRLLMAWASMYLLLDDPADRAALRNHMLTRLSDIESQWLGRRFLGNPAKPIRALETGTDPTFRDPQGNLIPSVIVWEHSIASMGYYAAWRVLNEPRFRAMALEVSRLVVNHCVFQEAGQWHACTAVRYLQGQQEGDALPASSYYIGSPDIHVGVSFWTWTLPAVLILRDLTTDPAEIARCNAILNDVVGSGPTRWDRSEWWAVLRR